MHAVERNRSLSEQLGRDTFHFHLHVIYVPVVEKAVKWTKRCKDPALAGTTREVIHQVSHSKKWPRVAQPDNPKVNGKPSFINSYSLLQDRFFQHMRDAEFTDFDRGERGSTAQHLSDLDYKIQKDYERIAALNDVAADKAGLVDNLQNSINAKENIIDSLSEQIQKKQEQVTSLNNRIGTLKKVDETLRGLGNIGKKTLFGKIELTHEEWDTVHALAAECLSLRTATLDLKNQLEKERRTSKTAIRDRDIYKAREETIRRDTSVFYQAIEKAPHKVQAMINEILSQPREQSATHRDTQEEWDDEWEL